VLLDGGLQPILSGNHFQGQGPELIFQNAHLQTRWVNLFLNKDYSKRLMFNYDLQICIEEVAHRNAWPGLWQRAAKQAS